MKNLRDWFKKDESEIGSNSPVKGGNIVSKKKHSFLLILAAVVAIVALLYFL